VYYALNKDTSKFVMTPPNHPIVLSVSNMTISGYQPGEFYVDPRTYIIDPPKKVSPWVEENIDFKKYYPKKWKPETIAKAKEEAYERYKTHKTVTGPITFMSNLTSIGDPREGKMMLTITFDRAISFPSYLKPSRLMRHLALSYAFPNFSLSDASTQLSTYMQTRPT